MERGGDHRGRSSSDHIHMYVSIPPKTSVAGFMGYLKGKSSLMIFRKLGNMKLAYRNREFWCKGYYVNTVTHFYGHYDNRLTSALKSSRISI